MQLKLQAQIHATHVARILAAQTRVVRTLVTHVRQKLVILAIRVLRRLAILVRRKLVILAIPARQKPATLAILVRQNS